MNTVNISVPAPNFDFDVVAQKKAKNIINLYIYIGNFTNPYINTTEKIIQDIKSDFYYLKELRLKIVFVNEIILSVVKIKSEHEDNVVKYSSKSNKLSSHNQLIQDSTLDSLNEMLFFLYGLLRDSGYNLDTNTFSNEEVSDLNSKIDSILQKLNEIQLGQEIIFDDIAELKNDFESLKSDYISGKKRWYQRAAGIVVSYAGTKGADEVYEQLKPLLHDFFTNHAQYFIDKL